MSKQESQKGNVNGFLDMIKSALPTIGKVAMSVIGSFMNEENGGRNGIYSIRLGTSENGEEEGVHFINKDGRVMAVNTSLTKTCTLNFPRKADNLGLAVQLPPFTQFDVTQDLQNSAKSNAQRFSVVSTPSELQCADTTGGTGVLSCLGYFTQKLIEKPFNLNSHIILQMVGKSLKITLRAGLRLESGHALTLGTSAGGELKRFNAIAATSTDADGNDAGLAYILLPDALADYADDDELELIGDLFFENVGCDSLDIRKGETLTPDQLQHFSAILR